MNTFIALIFLCASSTAASDCGANNAIDVAVGPRTDNEIACGIEAQEMIAQTAIRPREGEYLKISCVRRKERGGELGSERELLLSSVIGEANAGAPGLESSAPHGLAGAPRSLTATVVDARSPVDRRPAPVLALAVKAAEWPRTKSADDREAADVRWSEDEFRTQALPARPGRRLSRPAQGACRRALLSAALLGELFAMSSGANAETAYITNEKGNSISVIDLDKLEVVKTVPVGQRPRGITLSKDETEMYVCLGDDDTIAIVDTKTLKTIGDLPSGPDPEQLRLSPDGKLLFIANENDALLTAIDLSTRKAVSEFPVGVEPEGVAVSPDGAIVVNTSETTSMAHLIDWKAKTVVANILVDARPRYAEYTHDGSELWVTSEVGGVVSVIDPVKRVVTKKIAFEVPGLASDQIQPVGIRFSPDGKLAFIALGPANRVAVIDAATKKVLKYLLVGQRAWQLEVSPDGKYLLSTNGVSNDVSVIDLASLKVIKSIAVGSFPWGVAIARK